jgi:hypothetical protein
MSVGSSSSSRPRALLALAAALALAWPAERQAAHAAAQPAAGAALRIVVIAGEDAVNVIQQKTAVAPIVEVRDKNDQPVAGVLVRFVVRGGKGATLNGQTALSITTNSAGRAVVPAFSPTTAGALQIDVTASYGGQTATATINQTTYRTAAEAAKASQTGQQPNNAGNTSTNATNTSASAGGGGAAGSTGAAAGGGGGLSGTTIGLIAVGAGAGIFAVSKAAGGDSGGSGPGGSGGGGPGGGGSGGGGSGGGGAGAGGTQNLSVSGPFTLVTPISWTYVGGIGTCSFTETTTGTLRMNLQVQPSGAVTGTHDLTGTSTSSGLTCSFQGGTFPPGSGSNAPATLNGPVTGTTSNVTLTQTHSITDPSFTYTWELTFSGTLANGVVTGTLRENNTWAVPGVVTSMGGSGTTQVTLR